MTFEFKLTPPTRSPSPKRTLVKYFYKPNFILTTGSLHSGHFRLNKSFQDFKPPAIHRQKYTKKYTFKLQSYAFYAWYILIFILQSIFYYLYFGLIFTINLCVSLPRTLLLSSKHTLELVRTLVFKDTRDIWVITKKLELRIFSSSTISLVSKSLTLVKHSYLLIFTILCLSILNISSSAFVDQSKNSYFSSILTNYSPTNIQKIEDSKSAFNIFTVNASASPIQKITQYEIRSNDTLDKIAAMYGVSKDTLLVNNSLQSDLVNAGQSIYIPWIDGYIYKTEVDSTPEEVGLLFDLPKETILSENSAIFNPENGKFAKDTLVLIPHKDSRYLATKLIEIKSKRENERKQKEEETKRQEILAKQAVSSQSISNARSYKYSGNVSTNFIWPTTGSISRCYTSYHQGCDIANFSAPPVVAVANGVVIATYYYEVYGYGLAVVVDHGNGIQTLHAHLSAISVQKGQSVSQGEQLGIMGSTGLSTGTHLHFEVIDNGVKSDPLRYLP